MAVAIKVEPRFFRIVLKFKFMLVFKDDFLFLNKQQNGGILNGKERERSKIANG